MAQHRDPRYRGRRRTYRRPAGYLRTTYSENDIGLFQLDLERLYLSWPASVRQRDLRDFKRKDLKAIFISVGIMMAVASFMAIWYVLDWGLPWYWVVVITTVVLAYVAAMSYSTFKDNAGSHTADSIYREAQRRGIPCSRNRHNLYELMNKINADYNSKLWNRKFEW